MFIQKHKVTFLESPQSSLRVVAPIIGCNIYNGSKVFKLSSRQYDGGGSKWSWTCQRKTSCFRFSRIPSTTAIWRKDASVSCWHFISQVNSVISDYHRWVIPIFYGFQKHEKWSISSWILVDRKPNLYQWTALCRSCSTVPFLTNKGCYFKTFGDVLDLKMPQLLFKTV